MVAQFEQLHPFPVSFNLIPSPEIVRGKECVWRICPGRLSAAKFSPGRVRNITIMRSDHAIRQL